MQCFLRGFDLFPVAQNARRGIRHRNVHVGSVARGARSLVAEDVGMAANQLAIEVIENIRNGKAALVGRHLCIKQHLQKQITKLFGEVVEVAALNGVEDLIGLFKGVFANGVEGLLAVPWTAAGSAEPSHDGHRLLK